MLSRLGESQFSDGHLRFSSTAAPAGSSGGQDGKKGINMSTCFDRLIRSLRAHAMANSGSA